ncbi:MAG TPA: Tol-Pal system protein TolB, partial [Stellaceae bacterium]|nr:Tol-Pal system protein TolB [Stellaceae bacterium]
MRKTGLLAGTVINAFAAVVLSLLVTSAAHAELRLDITRGKVEPMPIAIPDFAGGGEAGQTGSQIAGVVSNDLESSGLFRPLDPKSFIQNVSTGDQPRFGDWRQINAQALVTGAVKGEGDGRFRV